MGTYTFSLTTPSNILKKLLKKNREVCLGAATPSILFTRLSPLDYLLFCSNDMRGRKFKDDLKSYLRNFLDSKPKEFYASGIYDLSRRWREVIRTNGEYIIDR